MSKHVMTIAEKYLQDLASTHDQIIYSVQEFSDEQAHAH